MKKLSQDGRLIEDEIDRIMSTEKPNQKEKVKIPDDELTPYYPKNIISMEQKKKYIVHCVKETSEREKRQKEYSR